MTNKEEELHITENTEKEDLKEEPQAEPDLVEGFPPELLEGLPPEIKKNIQVGMSMHRVAPMPNPIAGKITEAHINKVLDYTERSDERSFEHAKGNRKFALLYFIIIVALFVFLTIFLVSSDKALYKEVIKLFTVFLGGLGGGFGIKSYMDRNK